MCNPPTKKKRGGVGILGWKGAESFPSQSDFPGVQHCYDICLSGELAATGAASEDQLAANPLLSNLGRESPSVI